MIHTRGLTRYYGSLAAVQDLNLEVEPGEIFGFLGPNGAGKTTTIRLIVGLLRPTSGTVSVAGHDVQQEPLEAKRSLGYLAQSPLLYEKLTGYEFLRFLGGLHGLDDARIEKRSEHLLALLVYLVVFLATLPVSTTLMTIAREGRSIALLRSAPISMSVVLRSKFWASWLPMALWWTVVFLVAGLLIGLPLWQIGFLLVSPSGAQQVLLPPQPAWVGSLWISRQRN